MAMIQIETSVLSMDSYVKQSLGNQILKALLLGDQIVEVSLDSSKSSKHKKNS